MFIYLRIYSVRQVTTTMVWVGIGLFLKKFEFNYNNQTAGHEKICFCEKISSRLPVARNSLLRYLSTFILAAVVSVYTEKFSSSLARSRHFQARSCQAGWPACLYKHTPIFTMKLTTQGDPTTGLVRLLLPGCLNVKWASPASIFINSPFEM